MIHSCLFFYRVDDNISYNPAYDSLDIRNITMNDSYYNDYAMSMDGDYGMENMSDMSDMSDVGGEMSIYKINVFVHVCVCRKGVQNQRNTLKNKQIASIFCKFDAKCIRFRVKF